jgi:anti-sigma B factor antagonist
MTGARVREAWVDDVAVACVEGEVDAANVAEVGAAIRRLMTNRSIRLVVDLTGTTYLDSAGINLLFSLGEELRVRQQGLRIVVDPASPIARMLAITSLDRAFPTRATIADVLAAG